MPYIEDDKTYEILLGEEIVITKSLDLFTNEPRIVLIEKDGFGCTKLSFVKEIVIDGVKFVLS